MWNIRALKLCHTNEDTKNFPALKEDTIFIPKIGLLILFPKFAALQYYANPIIIVTHISDQSSWAFEFWVWRKIWKLRSHGLIAHGVKKGSALSGFAYSTF